MTAIYGFSAQAQGGVMYWVLGEFENLKISEFENFRHSQL